MMRTWPALILTSLLVLMVLIAFKPAYSRSLYKWECCRENACLKMPDGAVLATADGWKIVFISGPIAFQDTRIHRSPDDHFYLGFRGNGPTKELTCLYVPEIAA